MLSPQFRLRSVMVHGIPSPASSKKASSYFLSFSNAGPMFKNMCWLFWCRNWTGRPSDDFDRTEAWNGQGGLAFWRSWGSFNMRLRVPSKTENGCILARPCLAPCSVFRRGMVGSSSWHSCEMSPWDLHTATSSNAVETFLSVHQPPESRESLLTSRLTHSRPSYCSSCQPTGYLTHCPQDCLLAGMRITDTFFKVRVLSFEDKIPGALSPHQA